MAYADEDIDLDDGADDDVSSGDDVAESASQSERLEQRIRDEMAKPEYADAGVPGHRAQVERVQRLFAKRAEGRDSRTDVEKACDDALTKKAEKQSLDNDKAMEDYEWLIENGYESTADELPDVIPEYLAEAWRMQRLRAEGDYANLGLMMENSLSVAERQGRLPAGKASVIRELLRTEGVDPSLKNRVDEIADGIIALLHDAHAKKGTR